MKYIEIISNSEQILMDASDRFADELKERLPAPHKDLKMVVIIPAKNETKSIGHTLKALTKQRNVDGQPFPERFFEILVLCHNCQDDTYKTCLDFLNTYNASNFHAFVLNSDIANTVGSARRILMNIASERLGQDNGLIISTDADTIADAHWLFHLSAYIENETDMICGLIKSDIEGLVPQAAAYLVAKDAYLLLKAKLEDTLIPNTLDPWPKHSYNWGPNIAVKKAAYNKVGGLRPLHFLEDVDLYQRIIKQRLQVRHCNTVQVTTSSRTDARCPEGFGAELRIWTDYVGVQYNVESLEKLLSRFSVYALLKDYYKTGNKSNLELICTHIFLSIEALKDMIQPHSYYESMVIHMEQFLNQHDAWQDCYPDQSVFKVCKDINQYYQEMVSNL